MSGRFGWLLGGSSDAASSAGAAHDPANDESAAFAGGDDTTQAPARKAKRSYTPEQKVSLSRVLTTGMCHALKAETVDLLCQRFKLSGPQPMLLVNRVRFSNLEKANIHALLQAISVLPTPGQRIKPDLADLVWKHRKKFARFDPTAKAAAPKPTAAKQPGKRPATTQPHEAPPPEKRHNSQEGPPHLPLTDAVPRPGLNREQLRFAHFCFMKRALLEHAKAEHNFGRELQAIADVNRGACEFQFLKMVWEMLDDAEKQRYDCINEHCHCRA